MPDHTNPLFTDPAATPPPGPSPFDAPTDPSSPPTPPFHVVIAGAGPAGVLSAINFLSRNKEGCPPRYSVELVDGGEDFGALDQHGLQRKRSWVIGLAWPGLRAIRRIPRNTHHLPPTRSNPDAKIDHHTRFHSDLNPNLHPNPIPPPTLNLALLIL